MLTNPSYKGPVAQHFGLEDSSLILIIADLYNAKVYRGCRSRGAFLTCWYAGVVCFAGGWLLHERALRTLHRDRDR